MRPIDVPSHRWLDQGNGGDEDWLAGSRAPDGRARSPAELLDNLRLRLSELPGNHPSAPRAEDRQYDSDRAAPRSRGMPSDRPEARDRAERSGRDEQPGHDLPDEDASAGQLRKSSQSV